MTEHNLSLGGVAKLIKEYASNEVSLYILNNQEGDSWAIEITIKKLADRQLEIYKLIMQACGLEVAQ